MTTHNNKESEVEQRWADNQPLYSKVEMGEAVSEACGASRADERRRVYDELSRLLPTEYLPHRSPAERVKRALHQLSLGQQFTLP